MDNFGDFHVAISLKKRLNMLNMRVPAEVESVVYPTLEFSQNEV